MTKPTRYEPPADGADDPLYAEAVKLVQSRRMVSTSLVQRVFGIGWNRANQMILAMERAGLVSPFVLFQGRRVI